MSILVKWLVLVFLKITVTLIVLFAAYYWATYKKYQDPLTVIGGAIWYQIIVSIGLILSDTIGELLSTVMRIYFQVSGIMLMISASIILFLYELQLYYAKMRIKDVTPNKGTSRVVFKIGRNYAQPKYDHENFVISIILLFSACINVLDITLYFVL